MEKRRNSEVEKLEQLRSKLKQNGLTEARWSNTKILLRYLRHNARSVEGALKMIYLFESTRQKIYRECNDGPVPAEMILEHPMFVGGKDHEGRLIVMVPDLRSFNLKKYVERGQTKMYMKYMMTVNDFYGPVMLKLDVGTITLVLNVDHLEYSQYFHKNTMMFMLKIANLTTKSSPGEVDRVIILNAPGVAKIIYPAFKKILPSTMDIIFLQNFERGVWKKEFDQYFPKEAVTSEFGGTLTTHDIFMQDVVNFVADQGRKLEN